MEQYRQGLSKALQDKEKDLKAEAKQGVSRGGLDERMRLLSKVVIWLDLAKLLSSKSHQAGTPAIF